MKQHISGTSRHITSHHLMSPHIPYNTSPHLVHIIPHTTPSITSPHITSPTSYHITPSHLINITSSHLLHLTSLYLTLSHLPHLTYLTWYTSATSPHIPHLPHLPKLIHITYFISPNLSHLIYLTSLHLPHLVLSCLVFLPFLTSNLISPHLPYITCHRLALHCLVLIWFALHCIPQPCLTVYQCLAYLILTFSDDIYQVGFLCICQGHFTPYTIVYCYIN